MKSAATRPYKRLKMRKVLQSRTTTAVFRQKHHLMSCQTPYSLGERPSSSGDSKNIIYHRSSHSRLSQGWIKLLSLIRSRGNLSRLGLTINTPTLHMYSTFTRPVVSRPSRKRTKSLEISLKGWPSRPMPKGKRRRERPKRGTGNNT
jgi:hypothetical protein